MNLDTYRTPVAMSDAGRQARLFDGLPHDVGGLAQVVQGLMVHEHIAPAYGLTLSPEQHAQAHLRSVEKILETITAQDRKPLPVARPASERVVGVCRHFTLLHVAMLRAQGVAARARCGFGAYFVERMFIDHWVTEYWNEAQKRWVLVDAQLDGRQRELFKIGFDPLDVPRDQFLVAGQAWELCRAGKADPDSFAILDMHGLWLIAGNVIRDVAALNNHEMLPWDVWGAMTRNDAELDLPLIDRLAELSHAPDEHPAELQAAYEDQRIAVPGTVFNAVLNRPDPVH
jgi:transglutaminase superfamily protein